MKKWFNFFFLSFFSHKTSKEGVKRGYTNVFLGFILALIFLWAGFILGDMLPFGVHYGNAPDYSATVHRVFANTDIDKRIYAEIKDGSLKAKAQGDEYTESLLINTLENDLDKENYSVNGCDIVVDMRPADTPAEFEAYCVSSVDGTVISYEDYLTLSEVKRLNFDFKLKYTGNALKLDDETVDGYKSYVESLGEEGRGNIAKLESNLAEKAITKSEYGRAVYELYFTEYYPEISAYESTSKVPLLRNYYYLQYLSKGNNNCLFIFDDYMAGSFKTKGGTDVSFYGFYSHLENRALVADGATQDEANKSVDGFIKDSFKANWVVNAYAYAMNVISILPFVALMLMVATLLTYSVLRLCGVVNMTSLGSILRIVGSYVWFSGAVSAVLTVAIMFFVERNWISALPLVLFFVTLVIRSMIFAVNESRLVKKQSEQREAERTEE